MEKSFGGHGELVHLSENQGSPYNAKASDFKNPGGGKQGDTPGTKNKLFTQSKTQEGPRHNEDNGGPSVWGKGGTQFSVGKADEGSTGVSVPETLDLKTGKYHCRY